jgi:hypothetical protein
MNSLGARQLAFGRRNVAAPLASLEATTPSIAYRLEKPHVRLHGAVGASDIGPPGPEASIRR